jgi:hypothetical protein
MDEANSPTQDSVLPAEAKADVWPPAPTIAPVTETPFKNIQLRHKGYISDFRTGVIGVYNDGVTITGKAVMPSERQFWILFPVFFIRL